MNEQRGHLLLLANRARLLDVDRRRLDLDVAEALRAGCTRAEVAATLQISEGRVWRMAQRAKARAVQRG